MRFLAARVGLVLMLVAPISSNAAAAAHVDTLPPERALDGGTVMLWVGAAGLAFAAGLVPLFALRQGFDSPPRELPRAGSSAPVPESLPPAFAGALVARGRPALEHAAASLLALADRGEIRVEEGSRGAFRTRTYLLRRGPSRHTLAPHETAALDAAFAGGSEESVTLSKARGRLVRRFGRFGRALRAELEAAGLLDHDRQATRRAYLRTAAFLGGSAALTLLVWPFLIDAQGAWPFAPFLTTAALGAAAIAALVLYAVSTPLSNEGLRRAAQCRAYKDHLQAMAKQKEGLGAIAASALPHAVALGLAGEWSKHLKAYPVQPPGWFHSEDHGSGYATFIADAGAGAHGHQPHGAHG